MRENEPKTNCHNAKYHLYYNGKVRKIQKQYVIIHNIEQFTREPFLITSIFMLGIRVRSLWKYGVGRWCT